MVGDVMPSPKGAGNDVVDGLSGATAIGTNPVVALQNGPSACGGQVFHRRGFGSLAIALTRAWPTHAPPGRRRVHVAAVCVRMAAVAMGRARTTVIFGL